MGGQDGTHSFPSHRHPQSGVRKLDTINDWPLPLAFGFDFLVVWFHPVSCSSFWKKVNLSCVTRMSQKCPNAPGTGNPFGCGSSVPSLSHQWNCRLCSIQCSTNCRLYSTTSSLSWPSTYIPFLNFPYVHPRFASHQSAVLAEINTLHRPFHARTACISGLTMIFTTLSAFRFFFSINHALISSATSSSSRIMPCFWSIWWRGRSLHLKYAIAHSRMHHV